MLLFALPDPLNACVMVEPTFAIASLEAHQAVQQQRKSQGLAQMLISRTSLIEKELPYRRRDTTSQAACSRASGRQEHKKKHRKFAPALCLSARLQVARLWLQGSSLLALPGSKNLAT